MDRENINMQELHENAVLGINMKMPQCLYLTKV